MLRWPLPVMTVDDSSKQKHDAKHAAHKGALVSAVTTIPAQGVEQITIQQAACMTTVAASVEANSKRKKIAKGRVIWNSVAMEGLKRTIT